MNEKQKDTNSSAQQKLKEETTQLLSVVEETEKELEKSYRILAEEPKENGENAPLDQKIQKEIDSLKEVNNDLKQAHQRTMAMEDELSARFRDMQKSRDREWVSPESTCKRHHRPGGAPAQAFCAGYQRL